MGLTAILSGCKSYLAFDRVPFAEVDRNLKVFEELVELFQQRTPIPDDTEFPDLYPRLDKYDFPAYLFPGNRLEKALKEDRVRAIREVLLQRNLRTNIMADIRYAAPWDSANMVENNSVDMIFSQAVMEHVDKLRTSYEMMHQWLKPGGLFPTRLTSSVMERRNIGMVIGPTQIPFGNSSRGEDHIF